MIPAPTLLLSPTRVAGGMACMRKHALSDLLGQVANDRSSPALVFGEIMHEAAAMHWRGASVSAVGELLAHRLAQPLNDKHTLLLAQRMFAAYASQAQLMPFASDPSDWEVLEIEQRRHLNIAGFKLGFQIDRLLRRISTQQLALVDLKTASRTDARWEKQWPRSLQMKLYAECVAQDFGQPLAWQIIEGLAKDKPGVAYVIVPDVTAERRAEAVRAVEWVGRHDAQLLDACKSADGAIDVDRLVQRVLTETPCNEGNCFTYNSPCEYLPLCDAEPSERVALLSADYHYEMPKHLV
jgi:hypothetical protein